MPLQKIQDIIVQRPGSKIPKRILGRGESSVYSRAPRVGLASKEAGSPPRFPRFSSGRTLPRKKSHIFIWGAAIFAALVLVLAFSTFFEKATLLIVPKQKTASFDSIIVARKGAEQTGKNILPFEIMELSDSASREVKPTSLEKVLRRAAGTIVIYNDFSGESQRLIKNTRFESSGGKIYRIHESVTVPGQKKEDRKIVPGSVEAIIYADEPGEEYNAEPSDFVIPGFKGTPRFTKFYARGKTEIAGGFSGEVETIGEEEFRKVTAELKKELENKLLASASAEKPKGFVFFPDGVFTVFEENELPGKEGADKGLITVTQKATFYGVIFNEGVFSNFIAEKLSYAEEGARVTVKNFPELDFKIIDKANFKPEDDMQFSFTLKGEPHLVWEFDAGKLQDRLRDISKSELASVLVDFPSITRAEVTFRPFWKRSFPGETKDIVVETVSE